MNIEGTWRITRVTDGYSVVKYPRSFIYKLTTDLEPRDDFNLAWYLDANEEFRAAPELALPKADFYKIDWPYSLLKDLKDKESINLTVTKSGYCYVES